MGIQLYYHGIATLPPVARNDRKEEQGIPWKINCHPEGVERPWGSRCITTGLSRSLRSLAMTRWADEIATVVYPLRRSGLPRNDSGGMSSRQSIRNL